LKLLKQSGDEFVKIMDVYENEITLNNNNFSICENVYENLFDLNFLMGNIIIKKCL
jgi:hypothetical protein